MIGRRRMIDFNHFTLLTFDCYGTLIDWERGILGAVRPLLERSGVKANDDTVLETYAAAEAKHEKGGYVRYELVLRMVLAEMSLRLGFDVSPEEVLALPASIGRWRPFPDSVEALCRLKTRYKLAVVSNTDDRLFAATAKHLGVAFDWVITAEQARAYKPSPKIFDHAFAQFGIPREQILHVAQSIYHDIVPARQLGIASVWVSRRKGRRGAGATPPATATPDVEVADLRSLTKLMGL
jgi:2-haloacid dehalogenase